MWTILKVSWFERRCSTWAMNPSTLRQRPDAAEWKKRRLGFAATSPDDWALAIVSEWLLRGCRARRGARKSRPGGSRRFGEPDSGRSARRPGLFADRWSRGPGNDRDPPDAWSPGRARRAPRS